MLPFISSNPPQPPPHFFFFFCSSFFVCSRCLIVGDFNSPHLTCSLHVHFILACLQLTGLGSVQDVTLPAFPGLAAPPRCHNTNQAGHFYRSPSFHSQPSDRSFFHRRIRFAHLSIRLFFHLFIHSLLLFFFFFTMGKIALVLSFFHSPTSKYPAFHQPTHSTNPHLQVAAKSRSASTSATPRSTSSSDARTVTAITTRPTDRERRPPLQRNTSPCPVPSSSFLLHLFRFYHRLPRPLSHLRRCRRRLRQCLNSLPCAAHRHSRNSSRSSPSARTRRRRRRKRRRRRTSTAPRAGPLALVQASPATPAAAAAATTAIAMMSWTATTTTTTGTSKSRATEKSTSRGRGTSHTPSQFLYLRILTTHTATSTLRAAPDDVRHLCLLRRRHHLSAMSTRIGSAITSV